MSIGTWHGSQGGHEHPVSDATTLPSALFVRVPEVNALQDPQLDDIVSVTRLFEGLASVPRVLPWLKCGDRHRVTGYHKAGG